MWRRDAHRATIAVGGGLRKHAPGLDLARTRRLSFNLAATADELCFHDWHAGAVHFHVKDGHGGSGDLRQAQLLGPRNIVLFQALNVGANSLGLPPHCFGGDLKACQQLQLLAAVLEAYIAAHHCHHAPYAR